MNNDTSNPRESRKAKLGREALLSEPRPFRATMRAGEVLAIEPRALDFSFLFGGAEATDRTEDNIAIVKVSGPLEHHATWCWDSYESIVQRVEAAMTGVDISGSHEMRNGWRKDFIPVDPVPASAVVMVFDSPGGEAAGATWAHRKLRALRKQYGIPLYAYANECAASAAYELACACDEIWLPDTGTVGSIGVIATLADRTKQNERSGFIVELITSGDRKADSHIDRALDDAIRGRMQDRVMQLAEIFWRVVAKARGTSPKAVADLEAGVFIGNDAVDVGIADGVAGWDAFLSMVSLTLEQTNDSSAASAD